MTAKDAAKYLAQQLETIYDPGEAQSIADWATDHITGTTASERNLTKTFMLEPDKLEQFDLVLQKLLQHEPLQYVLNESWFCGLKLYVDKHVLIPRPETEELVEWIISNCRFPVDELSILDIGSGSGCIPIALKRRIRKANVWGCDISEPALEVARQNANKLGTEVAFMHVDFLNENDRSKLPKVDVIVSNPPYIPEKDQQQMQANVVKWEPAIALFVPDDNALLFYKAIAQFGLTHLRAGGSIYTEIHEDLAQEVLAVFQQLGYTTELKKDMQEKDRMVKATR